MYLPLLHYTMPKQCVFARQMYFLMVGGGVPIKRSRYRATKIFTYTIMNIVSSINSLILPYHLPYDMISIWCYPDPLP